jgi:hypothetical protein
MALSNPIKLPVTRASGRSGLSVDLRRPAELWQVTKLNGDSAGALQTGLRSVREVIVYTSAFVVDSTAVATTGIGAAGGNFSIDLSVLAAGTLFYVLAIGNRVGK